MASTTRNVFWITPLQTIAILGNAVNFGGSALQSPLIMPMLQLDRVPAQYAGAQITYLLTNSEFFFPPLNMLSTLSNLAATITCYLYKDSNRALSAKLPYVAVGFAMNVATTAYALTIMVPMNRQMVKHASSLEANSSDEKSEKELRRLQNKWKTLNYGRAALMIGAAIVGVIGLIEDGAVLRI